MACRRARSGRGLSALACDRRRAKCAAATVMVTRRGATAAAAAAAAASAAAARDGGDAAFDLLVALVLGLHRHDVAVVAHLAALHALELVLVRLELELQRALLAAQRAVGGHGLVAADALGRALLHPRALALHLAQRRLDLVVPPVQVPHRLLLLVRRLPPVLALKGSVEGLELPLERALLLLESHGSVGAHQAIEHAEVAALLAAAERLQVRQRSVRRRRRRVGAFAAPCRRHAACSSIALAAAAVAAAAGTAADGASRRRVAAAAAARCCARRRCIRSHRRPRATDTASSTIGGDGCSCRRA
mmetsp:Transcript_13381/g.46755  ORF Transcript_13381/g.46755 Transcript_13381/m.46755 type:complete len:304 (-) Transcript_13381:87-998(-)